MQSSFAFERSALASVHKEFAEWGWLFREQSAMDLGIDAHLEAPGDGFLSGRLIALVVKAGASYFSEKTMSGWVYRDTSAHLLYWLGHSLPVVLLLHDPRTRVTYWAHVTTRAVEYTSGGWKMLVPVVQALGPDSILAFAALADPPADTSAASEPSQRWLQAGQAMARAEAAAAEPVGQPAGEEFSTGSGH
jgi:hypothetical protein